MSPLIKYAGDDGARPGRPEKEIHLSSPEWFDLHQYDALMQGLDGPGWYEELAKRQRAETIRLGAYEDPFIGAAATNAALREKSGDEFGALEPITDPREMDRMMCRDVPVATVESNLDLKVAHYNNRLILEIDTGAHDNDLIPHIKEAIQAHRKRPRRQQYPVWADHRILALCDLLLKGEKDRKQLAAYLFPEIENVECRGKKFDRAQDCLDEALSNLPALRASNK